MATIDMRRKKGGGCCAPFVGGAGSPSNTMWPGPRSTSYQGASSSIQPFGHSRHGPKTGGCALLGKELGSHLTQRRVGRGLPPYQITSQSIQPFGHNGHGPKIRGMCPFGEGGAGSPSIFRNKNPGYACGWNYDRPTFKTLES